MNDLIYRWKSVKPVQMADKLSLPSGFVMDMYNHSNCDVVTATGKRDKHFLKVHVWELIYLSFSGAYSCLRVELTFARQLSFFIVTIYVPCFMIVIVSWMSFWIDHKAVREREIRREKPQLGKEEEGETLFISARGRKV